MLYVALAFAGLAALLHVQIFVLESLLWETPGVRGVFGTTPEIAAATRPLAFNQGFYNLFLAIVTGLGIGLIGVDRHVALTLVCTGTGSMLAAALVLVLSDPTKVRAAVIQGALPLFCLIDLLTWSLQ